MNYKTKHLVRQPDTFQEFGSYTKFSGLGAVLIDTLIVQLPVSPTQEYLRCSFSHPLIFANGVRLPKYIRNAKLNDVTITFVHYPPNPRYLNPWLSIQASLPKVLFGNKFQIITQKAQIDEEISLTQQFISDQKWLPEPDLGEAISWQVDSAFNHRVGEHVQDYVRALFKLELPKRKTELYYSTVCPRAALRLEHGKQTFHLFICSSEHAQRTEDSQRYKRANYPLLRQANYRCEYRTHTYR